MKIGIVCAMSKELMPLLLNLCNFNQENVYGYSVYRCKGKSEIIIVQSGIGEIYAGGATTLLITEGVDVVYNFGVCGSLKPDFVSCDVVAVKSVVHYDFDLSEIDGLPKGQYPSENQPEIYCDKDLFEKNVNKFGLKTGILASADKFVASSGVKKTLVKEFNADICDMEGAGVLLVCKNAKVPCFILKAVSDGQGGVEEYYSTVEKACKVCAKIIGDILED